MDIDFIIDNVLLIITGPMNLNHIKVMLIITLIINIYTIILLLYFIMNFFKNTILSGKSNKIIIYIYKFINNICELLVSIIKKYIPKFITFDISPIILIIIIQSLKVLINF